MKKQIIIGVLVIATFAVGCNKTVSTKVAETVIETKDRFAVDNEAIEVSLLPSQTYSDSERAKLSEDIEGELEEDINGNEQTSQELKDNRGVIDAMKRDIDAGVFPAEYMDTLEEDMPTIWLIGCKDKEFIASATQEIKDYWEAAHPTEKPSEAPAESKSTSKPSDNTSNKTSEKPSENKPSEAKKETQSSNRDDSVTITPEMQAVLDGLDSPEHKQAEEAAYGTPNMTPQPLSEQDQNIGMN